MKKILHKRARENGYVVAGVIPEDELILKYSMYGKSLLELPNNNPVVKAARIIARSIGLID